MSGLRNSSGMIVIDEAEAEEDIRRVQEARASLEEAKQFLNPAGIDTERMFGLTRDALETQFTRMNKDLAAWEDFCDSTISYIRNIVAEYQRIDREFAAKARELK